MDEGQSDQSDLTYTAALRARTVRLNADLQATEARVQRLWATVQRQEMLAMRLDLHLDLPRRIATAQRISAVLAERAESSRDRLARSRALIAQSHDLLGHRARQC